ncbi:MAG: transcription elongation factor GreA [Acidaminococcaceae bacterium]|nr:transcription elongation factor GreA [Acidaminococcaceae bacterium]
MVEEKTLLTLEGKQKLEEELVYLKTVKRPENTEAIKIARAQGDLSENAEYDAAKNEQAEIEHRIMDIETMLKNVEIIDGGSGNRNMVHVGGKVLLRDPEGEEVEYEIVGTKEADPFCNRISNECAVGKAIIGRRKGDKVVVDTPAGKLTYTVVKIINKK